MAGQTIKEVLVKWNIDISNWTTAFKQMAAMIDAQNAKTTASAQQIQSLIDDQTDSIEKLVDARKKETDELSAQMRIIRDIDSSYSSLQSNVESMLKAEKLITDELRKQAEYCQACAKGVAPKTTAGASPSKPTPLSGQAAPDYSKMIAEMNALRSVNKLSYEDEVEQRKKIVALLDAEITKKQQLGILTNKDVSDFNKLTRLRSQYSKKPPPGEGGKGGFLSGMWEHLTGGAGSIMFPKELMGVVAGGAALGGLAAAALEKAVEFAIDFAKEIVKLVEESDKFVNIWRTYNQLEQNIGANPARVMHELQVATHGLVDTTTLASQAIRVLGQNSGVSQQDVVQLTGTVYDLARAQGHDGAAALEALNRGLATGRLNMVAYQLGLENTVRTQLAATHELPESIRTMAEFNIVMDAAGKKLEELGSPVETVGTSITRLSKSWGDFKENVASTAVKTEGAELLQKALDAISESLENNKGLIQSLGDIFGSIMGVVGEFVNILSELASIFTTVWHGLTDTVQTFNLFASSITGTSNNISQFLLPFGSLKELLQAVKVILKELNAEFQRENEAQHALMTGDFVGYIKSWTDWWEKATGALKDYNDELEKNQQTTEGLAPLKGPSPDDAQRLGAHPYDSTNEARIREREEALKDYEFDLKTQRDLTAIKKLESDRRLQDTKASVEKEKELYSELYQSGAITFKKFIQEQVDARTRESAATIKNYEEQKAAAVALAKFEQQRFDLNIAVMKAKAEDANRRLDVAKKQGGDAYDKAAKEAEEQGRAVERATKAQQDRQSSLYKIILEWDNKEAAEKQKAAQDILRIYFQGDKDRLDAYKTTIAAIAKLDKESIDIRKQTNEDSFRKAAIPAEQYLQERVRLIQEEYQAEIAAAVETRAVTEDKQKAEADFRTKKAEAAIRQERELTQLVQEQWDIRTKAAEDAYSRVQSVLQAQMKLTTTTAVANPYEALGDQQKILQQLISLEKSRLEYEIKNLSTTKEGTTQWFQTLTNITNSQEALAKYNLELVKARDYGTQLARDFRDMASAAGMFPKGGKTAAGFQRAADVFETTQKLMNDAYSRIAERNTPKKLPISPEEAMQNAVKQAATGMSSFVEDVKNSATQAAAAFKENVQQMHDDYANAIPAAIQKTIESLNQFSSKLMQISGGTTGISASVISGPSGLKTAASPGGTSTSSDMQALDAEVRSQQVASSNSVFSMMSAALAANTSAIIANTNAHKDTAKGGLFGDLISSLKQMFGGIKKGAFGDVQEGLNGVIKDLSAVASAVGGMISAAKGQGGPMGAAMTGMASGAQLGQMLNFIPVVGPFMGAIGAGVGAVVGVFAGKARKEAEKISKTITAQFNAVLEGVQAGTVGLGEAVKAEIATIEQAVTQLSGKKGGRDELKKILPQMEQQLNQLQNQQKKTIESFDAKLEVLRAPESARALVAPVQQIIDQYKEYVQAGGSVQLANEYLQRSFQQLAQQGMEQLNQDEQDAIQNALQYNDLLIERQNLIADTNQQIQDIMSQGVAVRQMPQGVTKARQIQQLMQQSQNKLMQLDEEIAVSGHRLENERKIFDLSTTRIGLETQLVAIQNAQYDKQDAATASLMQEVAAFSSATPTNLPSALGLMGLGGTYISPGQEPALKPTPPVKTGIYEVDLQNQLQYQQALDYYNSQVGLSRTSTIAGMGVNTMGVGSAPAGSATQIGAAFDTQLYQTQLQVQQQITSLSSDRVAAETTLVNLQLQVIQADMQRLSTYKELLSAVTSGTTPTLEDMLQTVYTTRGRMGSGRFYGEIANPT